MIARGWWVLLLFFPCSAAADETRVVDGFENAAAWSAHPADGVKLALSNDVGMKGRSLRLDFEFTGGGYAVVHHDLNLDLPGNYAFSFRVRGHSQRNHLEFKLIDATGDNVWWNVRRDVTFTEDWQLFTIKKRQIQFAWGPKGGGEITHVAAIEFSVTAGNGGKGTVWLDELTLRPLPPPDAAPPQPRVRASSGKNPASALDGDPSTSWLASAKDKHPWIELDFRESREYGGLVIDWGKDAATDYFVQGSMDAKTWTTLREVKGSNGGRDYLYLPESESRFVRVSVSKPPGRIGIREISIKRLLWSASKESFFKAIALDAPRGAYPRGIRGEPSSWTVLGVDKDAWDALLGQDGVLETGKQRFSIEPFIFAGHRLTTWAQVDSVTPSLEDGYLPIPSVTWKTGSFRLTTTAYAAGAPRSAYLLSRYRVENAGPDTLRALLFLAIRPFQVNPPSQTLNTPGGCAPIRNLAWAGNMVRVDDRPAIKPLHSPAAFGAVSFDAGDLVADFLSRGVLPSGQQVTDPLEAASGALEYRLEIAPRGAADVDLLLPVESSPFSAVSAAADAKIVHKNWEYLANGVSIQLPRAARHAVDSFRSQIGYILVNRAGPAIQPGTRAYARSWIRDGSLTSSALLRAGRPEVVRDFIEWFAPYQYPNGKVPCVVDSRGADPVPEHDSDGEFLFLVAEYYRFSKDRDLVERHWPGIVSAVAYLDSLRHERLTDAYRTGENAKFFGILPPSISHEGYSAKPMHSYWDDFFALRGFKDAAFLARELGHTEDAARFGAIRDAFAKDLAGSIAAAMKEHKIDYVPGCADLGDFDATSTTIALSPAQASFVPKADLEATFERYYKFFEDRKNGAPWEAFTPYEIRNIGAFVRLGWRDRAQELLQYFLDHQTPRAWNQWAEVVWHDSTTAHFIGDMPHTWVGSDYMRSFLDCFAYDREADQSLVLAAGIPSRWVREDDGVKIKDLRTQYGLLSYQLKETKGVLEARIEKTLDVPPGGLVLLPPLPLSIHFGFPVTVNGKGATLSPDGAVIVRRLPAIVKYGPFPQVQHGP